MQNDVKPSNIKWTDPSVKILTPLTDERCMEMMSLIEIAGRTCYQSEPKGDPNKFIAGIVSRGHESVIEHAVITVQITTDRSMTHQLVRHRVGAYSQESTRYCRYDVGTYIDPIEFKYNGINGLTDNEREDLCCRFAVWRNACVESQKQYAQLIKHGCQKQEARSVLNNSLKTTIVVTYNLREWRHVFSLRCAKPAHAHIKQIMIPTLLYFRKKFPGVFDDIGYDVDFYEKYKKIIDKTVEEDFITVPKKNDDVDAIVDAANLLHDKCGSGKVEAKPSTKEDSTQEAKSDTPTADDVERWFEKCYNEIMTGPLPEYKSQTRSDDIDALDELFNPLRRRILDRNVVRPVQVVTPKQKVSYVAQMKMKCTYSEFPVMLKSTATMRQLDSCTTSFRIQTITPTVDFDNDSYSEVRDNVYLTQVITVDEDTPVTEVFNKARHAFRNMLIKHGRYDLLPYLQKFTFNEDKKG